MKQILQKLWRDDAGAVISTELTMILGIVVSGLTSGMVALRNNVNKSLSSVGDVTPLLPTTTDLQRQIAIQPAPFVAKSQSTATSTAYSASNVNVVVNVQYPSRNDIPSP